MNKYLTLTLAASFAAFVAQAPAVYAQGALVGVDAVDDRVDDIQDDIDDEFDKSQDSNRFGTEAYAPGTTGSVSAAASLTSGNNDTFDIELGGRLRNSNGPWTQTLAFAFEYGEDENVENKNEIFATYDVNRYFSENVYGFVLARGEHDKFDTIETDAFIGVGPGYRLFNTPQFAWRVQAGPGVRYTETADGDDSTEVAGIASSRMFYSFSDALFFTNDTDVLHSDINTLVVNDAGLNYKMTDTLSTRLGYQTEYSSDPLPGYDEFDHKLTAALVVSFQ